MSDYNQSKSLKDAVLFDISGGALGKSANTNLHQLETMRATVTYNSDIEISTTSTLGDRRFIFVPNECDDPDIGYIVAGYAASVSTTDSATTGNGFSSAATLGALFSNTSSWMTGIPVSVGSLGTVLSQANGGPLPLSLSAGSGYTTSMILGNNFDRGRTQTSRIDVRPTLIQAGSTNLQGQMYGALSSNTPIPSLLNKATLSAATGGGKNEFYNGVVTDGISSIQLGADSVEYFSNQAVTQVSQSTRYLKTTEYGTVTPGLQYGMCNYSDMGLYYYRGPMDFTANFEINDIGAPTVQATYRFQVFSIWGYTDDAGVAHVINSKDASGMMTITTEAAGATHPFCLNMTGTTVPPMPSRASNQSFFPIFFIGYTALITNTSGGALGNFDNLATSFQVRYDNANALTSQYSSVIAFEDYFGPISIMRNVHYRVIPVSAQASLLNDSLDPPVGSHILSNVAQVNRALLGHNFGFLGSSDQIKSYVRKLEDPSTLMRLADSSHSPDSTVLGATGSFKKALKTANSFLTGAEKAAVTAGAVGEMMASPMASYSSTAMSQYSAASKRPRDSLFASGPGVSDLQYGALSVPSFEQTVTLMDVNDLNEPPLEAPPGFAQRDSSGNSTSTSQTPPSGPPPSESGSETPGPPIGAKPSRTRKHPKPPVSPVFKGTSKRFKRIIQSLMISVRNLVPRKVVDDIHTMIHHCPYYHELPFHLGDEHISFAVLSRVIATVNSLSPSAIVDSVIHGTLSASGDGDTRYAAAAPIHLSASTFRRRLPEGLYNELNDNADLERALLDYCLGDSAAVNSLPESRKHILDNLLAKYNIGISTENLRASTKGMFGAGILLGKTAVGDSSLGKRSSREEDMIVNSDSSVMSYVNNIDITEATERLPVRFSKDLFDMMEDPGLLSNPPSASALGLSYFDKSWAISPNPVLLGKSANAIRTGDYPLSYSNNAANFPLVESTGDANKAMVHIASVVTGKHPIRATVVGSQSINELYTHLLYNVQRPDSSPFKMVFYLSKVFISTPETEAALLGITTFLASLNSSSEVVYIDVECPSVVLRPKLIDGTSFTLALLASLLGLPLGPVLSGSINSAGDTITGVGDIGAKIDAVSSVSSIFNSMVISSDLSATNHPEVRTMIDNASKGLSMLSPFKVRGLNLIAVSTPCELLASFMLGLVRADTADAKRVAANNGVIRSAWDYAGACLALLTNLMKNAEKNPASTPFVASFIRVVQGANGGVLDSNALGSISRPSLPEAIQLEKIVLEALGLAPTKAVAPQQQVQSAVESEQSKRETARWQRLVTDRTSALKTKSTINQSISSNKEAFEKLDGSPAPITDALSAEYFKRQKTDPSYGVDVFKGTLVKGAVPGKGGAYEPSDVFLPSTVPFTQRSNKVGGLKGQKPSLFSLLSQQTGL